MKKEDSRTYAMTRSIHQSPNGLTSTDFAPYPGFRVNRDLQPLIKRKVVTKIKEGFFNRYFVSDAQWAAYIAEVQFRNVVRKPPKPKVIKPPKPPKPPKEVKQRQPRPGRVLLLIELAKRPEGVDLHEKINERATPERMSRALSKLFKQGRLFRVQTGGHLYRYFESRAQADAFDNPYMRPQKERFTGNGLRFCEPEKRKQDRLKKESREKWNATEAILPYDANGNPLFKFTVCPGFNRDPIRSNTYPVLG